MSWSDEASQWLCAGTKRISIIENDALQTDGMISVFCRGDRSENRMSSSRWSGGSNSGECCLHVIITDGVHTFYKSVVSKDIRHMVSEEGKELEKVTSILLRSDDETFKVSYRRVEGQIFGGIDDSKKTTSVKVSIRKTCLNSIVRPVLESRLDNICHSCYDDLPLFARNALPEEMSQTESSSGLAIAVMSGDTINELHREIDALRAKNKQLETNNLLWKSTAEKLSNQWEAEKSELTDRFLTLFNEHKARHIETQRELDRLKGKRQRTTATERTCGTVSNRNNRQSTSKELLPDDEDEHDYAIYGEEEVARLAAGPDMKPKAQKRNNLSQGSGFFNPHTGATEFDDPKELFSSSEDEDMKTS